MNIYPISDLVRRSRQADELPTLPCVGADLVVVAGDVLGSVEDLEFLERIDAPVLLVLGNKDYYRCPPEQAMDMDDLVGAIRERLAGGNVTLLERDEVIIDGVRFLGGSMWTDAAGLRPLAASSGWGMNDSRYILARKAWQRFSVSEHRERLLESENEALAAKLRQLEDEGVGSGLMNPLMHAFLHEEFKEWLAPRLRTRFDGPTVVVTHHAPHRRSLKAMGVPETVFRRLDANDEWPRFSEDSFSVCTAAFGAVSDEWLLKSAGGRAALWIHGGAHWDNDYAVGGVRVVSNPLDSRPERANREAGIERPWMVDPFAGVQPVLTRLCREAIEVVQKQSGEFGTFAKRLPEASDDVVAGALLEAAQTRAARIVKQYEEWTQSVNDMVLGSGHLWPERLDRVVPGLMGVSLSALQQLQPDRVALAHWQIGYLEGLLQACTDLRGVRRQYLSRALTIVREKLAGSGYDFTLAANPEGHELAQLTIDADLKRTPGLQPDVLEKLREELDAELRLLALTLHEDGVLEVIRESNASSALRAIDLRVMVDGDECFDEPDC